MEYSNTIGRQYECFSENQSQRTITFAYFPTNCNISKFNTTVFFKLSYSGSSTLSYF